MCHRTHGQQIVLHGKIDIARADEPSFPLTTVLAVLHRPHHRVFSLERCPAARAEITIDATRFQQPLCFRIRLLVINVIIELVRLPGHDIIKFGNDGKHLHFKENRITPIPLKLDVQIALVVLPCLHPVVREAEAAQVTVEPFGNVIALAAHEIHLFVGNDYSLERLNLTVQLVGEPLGIDRMVAVNKLIFHLGARKIVNHGATHRHLVKIVVRKVGDNLSHCFFYFI